MARIAGVTTQMDEKGALTHITVDLKKHPEALPILKKIGLVEKSKFELDCEEGDWLTVEDARALSLKHIEEIWKK